MNTTTLAPPVSAPRAKETLLRQVRPPVNRDAPPVLERKTKERLLAYLLLGIGFGIILTKAEVISWFRIQEMFRFQSFHMYGIIGSAIAVAAAGVYAIKRMGLKDANGNLITIPPKVLGTGTRYWLGGTLFGLGWALLGACPGPIFALIGNGITVIVVALVSALVGTWVYGYLRPRLPH